jgi:uncharacterized protein (TIGR00369 family)
MSQVIHPRVVKLANGEVWKHLQVQVVSANNQQAELALPVTDQLKQVYGVLHGGITATLIDMAMGAACSTTLAEEEYGSTLDLHVHYLRPMFGKQLNAKAKVLKRGKRVVVLFAEAFDEQGEQVATATGQFMVLKR